MTPGELPGPPPVRWGVIGASSWIARRAVLPALEATPKAHLVALASRSGVGNEAFGACRVHASYEEVLADREVEAVYIPLPNHLHAEWTVKAAEAGKHVLCEKPLGRDAAEAAVMAATCADAGVALMEAYMTPFHPRSAVIDAELASGRLGLRTCFAAFTFLLDAGNHRWRADHGGGALLDVGIYCVAPMLTAAGSPPERVAATAVVDRGVDATMQARLEFGAGLVGDVLCSFEMPETQVLLALGTAAALSAERPFTPGPDESTFRLGPEVVDTGAGDCYRGMVDHFCTAVRGGTALRRPPEESVALLDVLDQVRAAAGLGRP